MDKKSDNARVHFIYWIGMLSFALVIMMTVKWSDEPKFTEYIGNVATFASLLLGVVAIFYSFTSNNNLSNSLGNIANASESLKHSELEVRNILDQSKLLTSNHGENIQKMHALSDSVQSSVLTLSDTLKEISEKTSELQSAFLPVPSQLGAIAEKLENKQQAAPTPPTNRQTMSADEAQYFIHVSPVYGNLLTYGCVLANQYGKEFSAEEFNKLINRPFAVLTIGFMECMIAAGIIQGDRVQGKDDYWIIKEIDPEVKKIIKPYLLEFIDATKSTDANKTFQYAHAIEIMEHSFASK